MVVEFLEGGVNWRVIIAYNNWFYILIYNMF